MEITTTEFIVRVIKEGRITIPSEIRELLKIKNGDFVKIKGLEKVEAK